MSIEKDDVIPKYHNTTRNANYEKDAVLYCTVLRRLSLEHTGSLEMQ